MATIVALIHGKAGAYGIGFPDFPGAVSGGTTLDEALARGRDTLTAHVAAFVQAGLDLPPIRTLDEIKADPACAETSPTRPGRRRDGRPPGQGCAPQHLDGRGLGRAHRRGGTGARREPIPFSRRSRPAPAWRAEPPTRAGP